PPPPTTPMNANWLPPVNITAESTMACQTSSPEAVASAPKEMPYRPVATPMDRPVRRMVRRRSGPPTAGAGRTLRGFGEAVVMMLDTLRSPGTMPPSRPACDVRIWDHDRYFGPRLLARARAAAARSGAAAGHGRHPDRLGAGRRTVLEHAVLRARRRHRVRRAAARQAGPAGARRGAPGSRGGRARGGAPPGRAARDLRRRRDRGAAGQRTAARRARCRRRDAGAPH